MTATCQNINGEMAALPERRGGGKTRRIGKHGMGRGMGMAQGGAFLPCWGKKPR